MSTTNTIQAGDLRVGNWVIQHYTDMVEPEQQIKSIGVNAVSTTDLNQVVKFDKLYPIELTPTILEECGFEKANDGYGGYLSEYFAGGKIRLVQSDISTFKWHNGCWDTIINSLHQLQNLYHSLTGKELKYKPLK